MFNIENTRGMAQAVNRVLLSAWAFLNVALSFVEPESIAYHMRAVGGKPADFCMYVLLGISAVTLLDTIINDLLPKRYSFAVSGRTRQHLWMVMGATFSGLAFVSVRVDGSLLWSVGYVLQAIWCSSVAFLDLYSKNAERRRDRRSTDWGDIGHA